MLTRACHGEFRVEVDDEVVQFWGDGNMGQEMCKTWVYSSGWFISGIIFARDISCVDGALPGLQNGVNTSKDDVGLLVSATSLPPSFDDSFVISIP